MVRNGAAAVVAGIFLSALCSTTPVIALQSAVHQELGRKTRDAVTATLPSEVAKYFKWLVVGTDQPDRAKTLTHGNVPSPLPFAPDLSENAPERAQHAFAAAVRAYGLQARLALTRFHDLRHTHATAMLASGVHPKIAQERLGHSTIAITMDLYSHVPPNMQADAVATMDEAL